MTPAVEPSELLAAEPAVLTHIRIGYARVSTGGQKLERQIDALKAAGCRRIFAEKKSGRDSDRPELAACLDFMTAGDTTICIKVTTPGRTVRVAIRYSHAKLNSVVGASCSIARPVRNSSGRGGLPPEVVGDQSQMIRAGLRPLAVTGNARVDPQPAGQPCHRY
ncbi:recombinase family protein [Micromonospora coerulea]|uniref:recombinase family protein n=1 Tax=Micromonospora coerulea TaxID=47856 RepID=UPI001905906E